MDLKWKSSVLLLLILIFSSIPNDSYARKKIRFNIEKIIKTSDYEYINFTNALYNSTKNPYFNLSLQVFKELDNLYMRTIAKLVSGVGKTGKQEIINQNMDMCYGRKGGNILSQLLFREFAKGNLSEITCPIESNTVYLADNVWLPEDEFPFYFPNTVFDVIFEFTSKINNKLLVLHHEFVNVRCIERKV